jgi:hypothetical protein
LSQKTKCSFACSSLQVRGATLERNGHPPHLPFVAACNTKSYSCCQCREKASNDVIAAERK